MSILPQKSNLQQQEWYSLLVDECKAIITEAEFTSRWAYVEGYHELGKRILQEHDNFERSKIYGKEITQRVAESLGRSQRTVEQSIQFVKKYPTLELLPEGKNTSWHDICNKYLPIPKIQTPPIPDGKYDVIYADPPWKYDVDLTSRSTRSPENNYPVMDLPDLVEFGQKVKGLSGENCTLFVWTTAPKLNWINQVLDAWGFEYKTNLIWDKVKPVMGHYSSVRHEILVIAGKGNAAPLCDGKTIQSIDSVQVIEKTEKHSQKPEEFRRIIEKLYPNTKKIELFARENHEGWDVWGNEI